MLLGTRMKLELMPVQRLWLVVHRNMVSVYRQLLDDYIDVTDWLSCTSKGNPRISLYNVLYQWT